MEKAIVAFVFGCLRGVVTAAILLVLIFLILWVLTFAARAVKKVARKIHRKPEQTSAFPTMRFLYDFELCGDLSELKQTIRIVNDCGYNLICVTQCEDTYTVFFRRFVGG